MNTCKIGLFTCALGAGFLAFGADYTYTAGTEGLTMAVGDIPADATTVTKAGPGVLTFTGDKGAFAGKFVVETGTVKARANAFAAGSSVEVKPGATWDMAGGGDTWSAPSPAAFTIAGAGDSANGYDAAFVRSSGTAIRNSGSKLVLTADATVSLVTAHNLGSVDLAGHKLTKKGAGRWDAYGSVTITTGGDTGAIAILAGEIQMQDGKPFNGGSEKNVLTLGAGTSFRQYPYTWNGPLIPWKLNVAGDATLCTCGSGATPVNDNLPQWTGPVELTGGNLTVTSEGVANQFQIVGTVTAVSGYGVIGTAKGEAIFRGDVTLGGGIQNAMVKNGSQGAMTFYGNVSQTNAAGVIKSQYGRLTFDGGESVELLGPIGEERDKGVDTGATGVYEVVNVAYVHHPNTTRLSGPAVNPQSLLVSNSTWDCGNNFTVVGHNASYGRASFIDATVTNCMAVGGDWSDYYSPVGAAWLCRTSMTVPNRSEGWINPFYLAHSSGSGNSYGYFQMDRSTLALPSRDVQLADSGRGFMHVTDGSTITCGSSIKTAQKNISYLDMLLSGGSKISCYQFVPGSGVVALEGSGTEILLRSTFKVNPMGGGVVTVAVNDGAAVRRLCRLYDAVTPDWHLSVNGGLLKVDYGDAVDFFSSEARAPASFVVGSEGVVVDTSESRPDSEGTVTFCKPMMAPTGKVVAAISLPEDAAFDAGVYLGPVKVTIAGAGQGAAAIALYDNAARRLSGIKVVAGGTGYDDNTTATITSFGGTATYACAVTMAAAPTTGKGLTKVGEKGLRLTQANTYLGPTTVAGGTLYLESALPDGSDLVITNGATVQLVGEKSVPVLQAYNGTLSGANATVSSLHVSAVPGETLTVAAGAELHLADGAVVTLTGDLSALDKAQKYALVSGKIVCEGAVVLPALGDHWKLSLKSSGITLKQEQGMAIIFR